ncbi:MAG: 5'/3'-nucleotidase SurE [bacterium]|nr:5'/3'-nucleotidase SurE [bacterium]
MKILLTNDDGVNANGIRGLYEAIKTTYDVTIIAPAKEANATSRSLTLRGPLKIKKLAPDIIAVYGTPTDCVVLGIHELLESKPDIVISGINNCANLGEDVGYSGTVGAAIEGAMSGIPSIALSFFNEDSRDFSDFDAAVDFIHKAVKALEDGRWNNPCMVLNVNIPYMPKGIRITKLGRRNYENIVSKHRNCYLIGGTRKDFIENETDIEACKESYISVTPLVLDLTNYDAINLLKGIF